MKMKFTFLFLSLFVGMAAFSANPTISCSVTPTHFCAGDSMRIIITCSDTFAPGNKFRIQISDSIGRFTNNKSFVFDSVYAQNTDTIYVLAPVVSPGTKFRIKVLATNPAVTGNQNSVDLAIHPNPSVHLTFPRDTFCSFINQVYLTGGAPAGAGGIYSGNFVDSTRATFDANSSGLGDFTVYYYYSDSLGCHGNDSSMLTITTCPDPSVAVSVSPTTFCPGDTMYISVLTSDLFASNNTFTVVMSDSTGSFTNATLVDTLQNQAGGVIRKLAPTVTPSAHYRMRASASVPLVTNSIASSEITFPTILTPPTVNFNVNRQQICRGDSAKIKVDSLKNKLYQWKFNNTNINNPKKYFYQAKDSGWYTVRVQDTSVAGCSVATNSVLITVNSHPTIPVDSPVGTITICNATGTVLFRNKQPVNWYTYNWTNNGTNISGATGLTYTATATGIYSLKAINGACSASAAATKVYIHANPVISFTIPYDSFCLYTPPIALLGAEPSGSTGYFSGQGVVSSHSYQPYATGTFTLQYTYVDSVGCRGTDSTTITIFDCVTSGIEQVTASHQLNMYPNPTSGQVKISTDETDAIQLKVYNILGKQMLSQTFRSEFNYDTRELPKGVYLVELTDATKRWTTTKRLVVQ